jgi:hypothetical protein
MYTRVKPSYLATNLCNQFVLSIRKKEESGSDIKCRCPATSPTSGTTPTLNQCTALENQVPSKTPPKYSHRTAILFALCPNCPSSQTVPKRHTTHAIPPIANPIQFQATRPSYLNIEICTAPAQLLHDRVHATTHNPLPHAGMTPSPIASHDLPISARSCSCS